MSTSVDLSFFSYIFWPKYDLRIISIWNLQCLCDVYLYNIFSLTGKVIQCLAQGTCVSGYVEEYNMRTGLLDPAGS